MSQDFSPSTRQVSLAERIIPPPPKKKKKKRKKEEVINKKIQFQTDFSPMRYGSSVLGIMVLALSRSPWLHWPFSSPYAIPIRFSTSMSSWIWNVSLKLNRYSYLETVAMTENLQIIFNVLCHILISNLAHDNHVNPSTDLLTFMFLAQMFHDKIFYYLHISYHQLRSRRVLMLFKDVPLRARRAL